VSCTATGACYETSELANSTRGLRSSPSVAYLTPCFATCTR